ncbi:MAG: hypothetical protein JSU63_18860 [Phycisphaerales bacterium]|nr:MAG: hypothetical protein JSU63_18860 [Phycisphaerales bacterium]
MIRKIIIVVLTLGALTAGTAWAANCVFPLAVLQTIGLAGESRLRGVVWELILPREESINSVWIRVREQSVHLTWYRYHPEALGRSRWYFYRGPWPAGIRTYTMGRPYKHRLADGTSVDYLSSSMVFMELPLWGLCLLLGAYPAVAFYRGPIRCWRRRRKGSCIKCGYDLTGNVSGVCSECGTAIDGP